MSKIKDFKKKKKQNKQTKQQHETSSKQAWLAGAGFTPSGLKGRGSRVGLVLAVSLDKTSLSTLSRAQWHRQHTSGSNQLVNKGRGWGKEGVAIVFLLQKNRMNNQRLGAPPWVVFLRKSRVIRTLFGQSGLKWRLFSYHISNDNSGINYAILPSNIPLGVKFQSIGIDVFSVPSHPTAHFVFYSIRRSFHHNDHQLWQSL